ncbi:SH3 domain-containing protein [Streptomyces sp. NPDC001815]|uniref:SH3 domain-containing protein n=1 Tax=Streptomyces sp. NPDC001815 TaxID=3154526 RepID=UPI00332BB83E
MHGISSHSMTKLMITAAVGVMAAAGMAAPAAAAEHRSADRSTSQSAGVQAQTVTTWINGNVRIGPDTGYSIAYTVAANQNLSAECWLEGGFVNANGVYHDKWVLLSDGNYIWGGLLKGNEVGNVSRYCLA